MKRAADTMKRADIKQLPRVKPVKCERCGHRYEEGWERCYWCGLDPRLETQPAERRAVERSGHEERMVQREGAERYGLERNGEAAMAWDFEGGAAADYARRRAVQSAWAARALRKEEKKVSTSASKIQWTDRTWNPVRGCSMVSPGCTNCYAMRVAWRFSGPGQPYEGLVRRSENGPIWTGKIRLVEEALSEPARWRKPERVFVNSMSDLFHEDVTQVFLTRVFKVMREAPQYTFQILTKRAARMAVILSTLHANGREPGSNVWCGVSVENQEQAAARIPLLVETPAAVRFLSVEPMLEPIQLHLLADSAIHWVIVGGESGPNARPCNVSWIRDIVKQCKYAGVPVFVKQLGASCYSTHREDQQSKPILVDLHDFKGGDISEWPEDLRIREFPRATTEQPMDTASRRHG